PDDRVTGIRANANGNGVILLGTGSSATDNVVWSNTGIGYGIYFAAANGKVTSNVARENAAAGIVVTGAGVLVQANQSENNGNDGIGDAGLGNTFIGNVTNANAGDGIDSVGDQTATIAFNTANYNTGYGIMAS